MQDLRAVFFDIDDTLFSTSEFARAARRKAADAMVALGGMKVAAEDLLRELEEVIAEFGSNYDSHYDRMLRRFPADALGGHNRAILVAVGVAAYHSTKPEGLRPYPGAREALEALRGTGRLVLGVITEGLEVKQAEKLVRLDVYRFLDRNAVFISDQIGISKPNPKLYARACAAVGVPPPEALYVGDNPAADIAPARATGMRTVRFRRPGGKHAAEEGHAAPDHEVSDFAGLRRVLRESYGIPV